MFLRELTSQPRMASHILSMTSSRWGSSMVQASGPSNMMWESTPQALYDTSMPSALLSNRLLQRHADRGQKPSRTFRVEIFVLGILAVAHVLHSSEETNGNPPPPQKKRRLPL